MDKLDNNFVTSKFKQNKKMLHSNAIGNKIAIQRKKINLSQSELSQKVSISPQAVGKWERGESMPDIATLNLLAEIFGVDLNYFSENTKTNDAVVQESNPAETTSQEPKKRFDWQWDMSQGNWVDADFSGLKGLKDQFTASNIKNCKFIQSDLSGLTLKSNDISLCDFSNSDIRNSKIQSSEISQSKFQACVLIDAIFTHCEINQCDFNNSDFSGTEFLNSSFQKNNLENAVWKHTSFKNVGITNMIFNGNISDCLFENCLFKTVKFQNATLVNTFFKHNRKFNKVEFVDCKADKLTFAFLKANGAKMDGLSIIE
jgi:transcriptional regulator with XRE-family HTH domain